MKKTVIVCDRCGEDAGNLHTPLVFEFPKARACAEDDNSYTETFDLCGTCATGMLVNMVSTLPRDQWQALGQRLLEGRNGLATRRSQAGRG